MMVKHPFVSELPTKVVGLNSPQEFILQQVIGYALVLKSKEKTNRQYLNFFVLSALIVWFIDGAIPFNGSKATCGFPEVKINFSCIGIRIYND